MLTPRPISREAIPAALSRAERYRLLNDASAAESICLDVLEVEPENQEAVIMLVLSISDQLSEAVGQNERRARELLPRIQDEYKRAYYEGVICERRARAHLKLGSHAAGELAWEWLHEAMSHYERAERLRPAANDEAILRWNTCIRILNQHGDHIRPAAPAQYEPTME